MSFFLSCLLLNVVFAEGRPHIAVKAEVSINEERTLSLGDLTDISGFSPSSKEKIQQFQLGKTPDLGTQQTFTSNFISGVLRQALENIDPSEKQGVLIKIPPKILVMNQVPVANSKNIEHKLRAHWEKLCAECRFVVVNLITPPIPEILKNQPWLLKFTDNIPRGQIAIPLEVQNPEGVSRLFWVRGQVQVQKEVPVTSRAMSFGERIDQADIKFEWRDVTFAYDSAPDRDQVIGRKINRSLRTNEILLSGVLEKERALKRGDVVRVVVGGENWSVMSNAIAEEDGFIGDTVRVRSDKTKKTMTGVVQGDGEVTVR